MNIEYTKNVVIVSGESATVSGIASVADLYRAEDLSNEKVIRFLIQGTPNIFNAWTGDAYDSIGQWTDVQLSGRAKELLEALPAIVV